MDLLTLNPTALKEHCRLSERTFHNLMGMLREVIPKRHHGYSRHFAVIVTLFWLAAGTSYRVTGMIFDLTRSTMLDICTMVLNGIMKITKRVIHYPSEEELPDVGSNFQRMADSPAFSQCVGAIDGCQVRTICHDVDRHDEYINRKLYYSFHLQGLVDHQGRFIDICVGFPGSCHDMRVLRHIGLFREGVYPPRGYFIIGDGGYACLRDPITLIVPYRRINLTEAQKSFNYHLSKARSVVERAFGALQTRWRMLFHRALEVKAARTVKVITACCVLLNLCIDCNDFVEPAPVERRVQHEVRGQADGEAFRNVICLANYAGLLQARAERGVEN